MFQNFISDYPCKKDIWILWDNSYSLGEKAFQDEVRPFMKNLINSTNLNVGPNGTHIGILSFSTQANTRVLLELGEKKTRDELLYYLDCLKYNRISGNGTRTGMALKIADEKFPWVSPQNYRADVGDVILIFTNGEPVRRPGEDNFGDKYKSSRFGESMLAKDRAQNLRSRDIVVAQLAVGTNYTLRKFRKNVKEWSPAEIYFEMNKYHLESNNTIMVELIRSFGIK
ncbi:Hypothetical predicted protein, partial [Paramuricea clavata]